MTLYFGEPDHPRVVLMLSRVLELAGMPMDEVMSKDLGGFARMLEHAVLSGMEKRTDGQGSDKVIYHVWDEEK